VDVQGVGDALLLGQQGGCSAPISNRTLSEIVYRPI
jgi:hypothetical protein